MPITMNTFKCSNGHSFEANAKLRTRCPECGVMTKRSFVAAIPTPEPKPPEPKPDPEPGPEHKTEPVIKQERKKPVLIRQGRERVMATRKPKEKPLPPKKTLIGSKVSGGLVSTKSVRTRGAMPTIKGRPKKTAVARGSVAGHEVRKPYWHAVADKFGI